MTNQWLATVSRSTSSVKYFLLSTTRPQRRKHCSIGLRSVPFRNEVKELQMIGHRDFIYLYLYFSCNLFFLVVGNFAVKCCLVVYVLFDLVCELWFQNVVFAFWCIMMLHILWWWLWLWLYYSLIAPLHSNNKWFVHHTITWHITLFDVYIVCSDTK